ncbi:MAG: helix-turn-helix domain-containing protein [Acutalibacteraceae bacterium]
MGYFKEDILLCYHDNSNETEQKINKSYADSRYLLFFMLRGKATVQKGNSCFTIKENEFLVVDMNTIFSYNFFGDMHCECIVARLHHKVFSDISDDKFFLRVFENQSFTDRVHRFSDKNYERIAPLVYGIKLACENHLGRAHLLPRINSIISELCMIYDYEYKEDNRSTDSVPVMLCEYVTRHFAEPITYDFLSKKFFVSRPTINAIMHNFTGKTLKKYLEYLRLNEARRIMKNDMDLIKVAELCGFNSYSAFYRTYVRNFGRAPSEDCNTVKHKKWPLS